MSQGRAYFVRHDTGEVVEFGAVAWPIQVAYRIDEYPENFEMLDGDITIKLALRASNRTWFAMFGKPYRLKRSARAVRKRGRR